MIQCKVCKQRNKNIVLLKCHHTFCNICAEKTIESRSRKCPTCRMKISSEDIKAIWWD